jgi:hypothetical protein
MKIEITRKIEQKEIIEIEFPYYYKHDLMLDESDSVIYGKIEEEKHTAIQISNDYRGAEEFSVEVEKRKAVTLDCYLTDEYKSDEAEYLAAKTKLLAAAQNA